MEVLLFPYLPLADRLTIGGWELIPREELTATDTSSDEVVEYAQGVAALYRMPRADRGFGAFIRPPAGRVGDPAPEGWRTLYHAVVVLLLDQNPSRAVAGMAEDYNAGHRMCTTENALLFGHRFGRDLYTGYETGTMVMTKHLGPQIGETRDVIQPPVDMNLPLMRPQFDHVYAEALHDVLSNLGDDDPDLPGAIRWLELAWTNSASIDPAARILALRAGFDVLFSNSNASTTEIRSRLSELLDDPDAPRTHREWDDHTRHREGELTDLEWWFQSFTLLRNKVAHGGEIPATEFDFEDGVPHVWHGEWQLRQAIKRTVATAGHKEVLLDAWDRAARRGACCRCWRRRSSRTLTLTTLWVPTSSVYIRAAWVAGGEFEPEEPERAAPGRDLSSTATAGT
jgi:hypothetical protein